MLTRILTATMPKQEHVDFVIPMNVFETIGKVTSRIEPYHSQFLADALSDSLNGDRSLFDAVWRLAAPPEWEPPENAIVNAEEVVSGQGRVDILIKSDSPNPRILGIEVKTTDASTTPGQLERYRCGLAKKFAEHEIAIVFLTPFTREWAPDKADALATVKEFKEFQGEHPGAKTKHISWLDVAAIPWDGNELWRQHQLYVYQHIASHKKLRLTTERDRSLDQFFGGSTVDAFWEALSELGIASNDGGATIELVESQNTPDFAQNLAEAFEILIREGEGVSQTANHSDRFAAELRQRFLDSSYREVHEALFNLSVRYRHVSVRGQGNYGLRVAHSEFNSVSLVTSAGIERLRIVGQR